MQRKETKNTMVSLRSGIFVFAIVFMLLHIIAYSIQDAKMVTVAGDKFAEEGTLSPQEKGSWKAVHVSDETMIHGKIIGRRMLMKMVKEEHLNGEEMASKKVLSSSSASPRTRDDKVPKRSKKIDHHDHKMRSTFMALNSDYHVPRPHPPKNN